MTYGAGGSTRERTHAPSSASSPRPRSCRRRISLASRRRATRSTPWSAIIATPACVTSWRCAAIRPAASGERYAPHPGGYRNAADLVAGIKRLADVEVSVSAYPEKHPDSPTVEADIDMLKPPRSMPARRARSRSSSSRTTAISRYLDRVRARGIDMPIVPGILPVQNFKQTKNFAARCGASVPDWLAATLRRARR